MSDFFYVVKLLYSKDKQNLILYLVTNLLSTPILFAELFTTKYVVDLIQNFTNASYIHVMFLVSLLMIFLYLAGINGSIRAISQTNLTATSLYELDHSILVKTSQLPMVLLEDPCIKTQRDQAKRLSLFDLLDQWIGVTVQLVTSIALIVVMSCYGFYMGFIILGVLFLQLYMSKKSSQQQEAIAQSQTSSIRVINYLVDLLVNRNTIQEVRIYRMSAYLFNKMREMFVHNFNKLHRRVIYSESINFAQGLIIILLNGVTIAVLAISLGKDGHSAGLFVLLLQVSNQLFLVIPTLTKLYSGLMLSRLRYREYITYIELQEQKGRDVEPIMNTSAMQIKINNLYFRYPTSTQDTLCNINIKIHPGERVAFVGENGSGKSTLLKLILGLYQPTAGNIQWFKGTHKVQAHNVIQEIRVVFQDFTKLHRPIRENLALGNIDAIQDDSLLLAALQKAEADSYGLSLDTLVGPQFGGIDLSGGQWQKLAIARAYLNDGSLTIFDEPTAALDPFAEQKAFDTFVKLGENQTSIIVTHRLYMSKFVDKIFLFENGQIIESGNHEQLMRLNGKYQKMFDLQSSLYV